MMNTNDTAKAALLLRQDKLVAFPTETVYGLGGNALSDAAVANIYAAKGRPRFNPLIVHVDTLAAAREYAKWNDLAEELGKRFWPGPLTLIVKRRENCPLSLLVSAGMDTVALRVPAHPLARALLAAAALPIAAPSANRSGRISPTAAAHVREEMGDRVAMILDGGACPIGIESTVVDASGGVPVLLRPGIITPAFIAEATLLTIQTPQQVWECSPGMTASHYAPDKPLRLGATSVEAGEALLAFGAQVPAGTGIVENLSVKGDLKEAAANLFRMLRSLDKTGAARIAVMPIPEEGAENALGVAINDRLARAAAPRPHQAS